MTGSKGAAGVTGRTNAEAHWDTDQPSETEVANTSVGQRTYAAGLGSGSLRAGPKPVRDEFNDLEARVGPGRFVERQTYRRRRLADSARAIPVLGMLLWFVPLLWAGNDNGVRATHALIYIFVVWIGLVVLSVGILAALRRAEKRSAKDRRGLGEPQLQQFARNLSPLDTSPTIGSDTQSEGQQ